MRLYNDGERYSVPLQVGRVPFPPALASLRFRLASQSLAFSVGRWVTEVRVVFGRGGWPNGMVQLLFVNGCAVIR